MKKVTAVGQEDGHLVIIDHGGRLMPAVLARGHHPTHAPGHPYDHRRGRGGQPQSRHRKACRSFMACGPPQRGVGWVSALAVMGPHGLRYGPLPMAGVKPKPPHKRALEQADVGQGGPRRVLKAPPRRPGHRWLILAATHVDHLAHGRRAVGQGLAPPSST
jgi:hypothetical protein